MQITKEVKSQEEEKREKKDTFRFIKRKAEKEVEIHYLINVCYAVYRTTQQYSLW